jgi:hypothetical protein
MQRIALTASCFETRDRLSSVDFEVDPEKSLGGWRPLSRRKPIHILNPPGKAIMQTSLLFLALSDPSPRALMIMGAISLGSLAIFLRHKLG